MTCKTSLKEKNRVLTSLNNDKQLKDTLHVSEIINENSERSGKTAAGRRFQEGNPQERSMQHTMMVRLKVPRKAAVYTKRLYLLDNAGSQRKSPAQKEINSVQRKKQIAEYNSLKLKEERQQRYRIRRGGEPAYVYRKYDTHRKPMSSITSDEDDTPPSKKKKRVSFES